MKVGGPDIQALFRIAVKEPCCKKVAKQPDDRNDKHYPADDRLGVQELFDRLNHKKSADTHQCHRVHKGSQYLRPLKTE